MITITGLKLLTNLIGCPQAARCTSNPIGKTKIGENWPLKILELIGKNTPADAKTSYDKIRISKEF